MTAIFPALPGLGWSVSKTPRFATRIQRAVSGRELRVLDQPNPIWSWTLTYSMLRDRNDTRAATGPRAGRRPCCLRGAPGGGWGWRGGGFAEPITAPNSLSAIYFNGVHQSSS